MKTYSNTHHSKIHGYWISNSTDVTSLRNVHTRNVVPKVRCLLWSTVDSHQSTIDNNRALWSTSIDLRYLVLHLPLALDTIAQVLATGDRPHPLCGTQSWTKVLWTTSTDLRHLALQLPLALDTAIAHNKYEVPQTDPCDLHTQWSNTYLVLGPGGVFWAN